MATTLDAGEYQLRHMIRAQSDFDARDRQLRRLRTAGVSVRDLAVFYGLSESRVRAITRAKPVTA